VLLHRPAEGEPILLAAAQGLEATRGPGFRGTQEAYEALQALYTERGDAEAAAHWAAKLQAATTGSAAAGGGKH
jgi:hypothetical protein